MRYSDSVYSKLRRFVGKMIFHILGVLFILTMISIWLVCGMLARYTSEGEKSGGARVASAGQVDVFENEAYFDYTTYTYLIDKDKIVTENTYNVIVPGMEIEKDPFIRLYGNNEVSYNLYIEIKVSDPELIRYSMSSVWSQTDDLSPAYGGTVYKYQSVIAPGYQGDILDILEDGVIRIRDDLKDKTYPQANSDTFKMDIYAYLTQTD